MNKWKIIGAIAALLIAGLVALTVAVKSQHRGVITAASRSIASDLIAATNSSHLVHMSPFLRARLARLLGSPSHLASVFMGDAPPPVGDGSACSRLVLTNNAGQRLLIRL
jgi:hypothetical protein